MKFPQSTAVLLVLLISPSLASGSNLRSGNALSNKLLRHAVSEWLSNRTSAIQAYGHISFWDVSRVTDFSRLFIDMSEFDEDLSAWNMRKAQDTSHMFKGALLFKSDLSKWNTANVRDMSHMFHDAASFTSDLSAWNTDKVFDFSYMFSGATLFDGDVSTWDVTNSHTLKYMFFNATSFRGDVSRWTIPKMKESSEPVTGIQYRWAQNMRSMFEGAVLFNSDLSQWETWSTYNMNSMFKDASSFTGGEDGSLSGWNVKHVEDFREMFVGSRFDQELCWTVKSDSNTTGMFDEAGGALRSECQTIRHTGDDGQKWPQESSEAASPMSAALLMCVVATLGLVASIV